jgi:hypothetical protein
MRTEGTGSSDMRTGMGATGMLTNGRTGQREEDADLWTDGRTDEALMSGSGSGSSDERA